MKKYLLIGIIFPLFLQAKEVELTNKFKNNIDCSEYSTNAWIVMTLKQKNFNDKRVKRTYTGYSLIENIDKLLIESKDYKIEKTRAKKELVANQFKSKIEKQCRNKI